MDKTTYIQCMMKLMAKHLPDQADEDEYLARTATLAGHIVSARRKAREKKEAENGQKSTESTG